MNNMPAQILEMLSNPQDTKNKINEFATNIEGDPESKVRELVNSGRMTQAQYNLLSKAASMLMKQM